MRWLVWYIRSCFCTHAWDYDERVVQYDVNRFLAVSATCRHCGWHRTYHKFEVK